MPIRECDGGIDMGIQINNVYIFHLVKAKKWGNGGRGEKYIHIA